MTTRPIRHAWLGALAVAACSSPEHSGEATSAPLIELEQIARIGAFAEGPEEYLFSEIYAVAVDSVSGEIYVADQGSGDIRVFDRKGSFVRRIGRPGNGPGEFDYVPAFDVHRDTVLAFDRTGLHLFSRSGAHLATYRYETPGAFPQPYQVVADQLGWKLRTFEFNAQDRSADMHHRLYRVDFDAMSVGDPIGEIAISEEQGIFFDQPQLGFVGDGFVVADGIDYAFTFVSGSTESPDTLRFPFEPIPVDASAYKEYARVQRERCEGSRDGARCLERAQDRIDTRTSRPIPPFRPVIGGFVGSRRGLLLVGRADVDPTPFVSGDLTHWDLVDLEGRLIGRVEFPVGFLPQWFGYGEVWGYERDDFGVPYVVGYRLERDQ